MTRRRLGFISLAVFLLLSSFAGADELEIRLLIKQLDAPTFAQRQEATQKLQAMGKTAFPALQKAAQSAAREVAARAITILKQHMDNGNQQTKAAAKKVLQHLSQSTEGRAAQMAKEALRPKPAPSQPRIPGGNIQIMQGINPAMLPAQIQINGQIIAGNKHRISIRVANGTKDIDVEENGRAIKIHEGAKGDIQIEISEKKNGKKQTKKYKANNVAELKKKHPEAHKIYEQYAKGQGAFQIRLQAGGMQIIPPNGPNKQVELHQKHIQKMIDNLKKQIEQNKGNQQHLQRMIDHLKKQQQQMEQTKKAADKPADKNT